MTRQSCASCRFSSLSSRASRSASFFLCALFFEYSWWRRWSFAYWIGCESAFGMTLGKRLFSIRVERSDGGLPSIGQSIARNLLRIVDGFPYILPYLIGFIVAMSSGERQRIGDRAAGTRVVRRD